MEKLIKQLDGSFKNQEGQEFVPASYVMESDKADGKFYRKGTDEEVLSDTYEVLLSEDLNRDEKDYLDKIGVSHGENYLADNGFEL